MFPTRWLTLSCICVPLIGGCTLHSPSPRWLQDRGGLTSGPAHDRLRFVAGPLVKCLDDHRVRIGLLNSSMLGAYAWPGGEVYVTRGLVEKMADDELAAAVAHELGHLLAHGSMPVPASLRGCAEGKARDEETRADALGVQLLRISGIDPTAMDRMLAKLAADSSLGGPCRTAILQRIERLEALDQ